MIEKTRIQVAEIAKEMLEKGLTDGTAGNVSILNEETQLVAITPSSIPYDNMTAEQISVVNLDGEVVWGEYKPSSEYRMHIDAIKSGNEVKSVIHTHSHFALAMACAHKAIPAITVDMAAYCGVEAAVVPYETPGSEEIAAAVQEHVERGERAMLLANHGVVFVSPDPNLLITGAEAIELAAMAYIRGSAIGKPVTIAKQDVETLLDLVYGQQRAV